MSIKMSKKGFAPVELLVAIVASLFVLGAIVATFIVLDKEDYHRGAQIADAQKNLRTGTEGKERQVPAPPKRLTEGGKRGEEPEPLIVLPVKHSEQEAAAPVTEEGPSKTEARVLSLLELAELKPPAAGQAPTPQVTVESEEVIRGPHREAEIVAGASSERPSAAMPRGGTFTINLASFRQKQRAGRYIEELKKLGIHAYSWEVNLPEKGRWYRVAVGGFLTVKEANNHRKELRQKGISDSFITKIAGSSQYERQRISFPVRAADKSS